MKIKLDENIPNSVARILADLGHNVETVLQEGMEGEPDKRIWEQAQKEGRFLITQDLDFSDIRSFVPGTHHGLLLVRLRSPGRVALTLKIRDIFKNEAVTDWRECFVVLTDRKLRVRCPDK